MADTPTHEALKPCPFCGSDKITEYSGDESTRYRCRNCGASSGRVYFSAGEREAEDYSLSEGIALEAWNSRAALAAADAALSVQAEPVATVTECEACFTPDVCQLRGTCDHYAAERLRVAATPQPPAPVPAVPLTDGELWSWVRRVMSQGADIRIDYENGFHKGYEAYSARLDAAAAERAQELAQRLNITGADHG